MKGNNSNTSITFNEIKISEAQSLLNEIKNDLSEVDNTLYDAVMKISNANGIEFVEVDDSAIDMRMPERLMIQCREDTKSISDTINNMVRSMETFIGEKAVSVGEDISNNVQSGQENISGVTAEQGESKMMIKGPDGKLIEVSEDDLKRMTSNGGGLNINSTPDTTPQTSSVTTPTPTTVPGTLPTNPQTNAPASTVPPTMATSVPKNQVVYAGPSYFENKDTLPELTTIPLPDQELYAGPSYFDETNPVNPNTPDHLADIKVPTNQVVYAGPSYFENNTNPVNPNTPDHLADIKVPTNQVVYAGPSYFENNTNPVNPNNPGHLADVKVPTNQVVYAGPSYFENQTTPVTTPTVPVFDPKKGDDLGTIIINNGNNNTQPISNNPITNTDIVNTTSAIQERVSDTALSQHTLPNTTTDYTSETNNDISYSESAPQYSSIPETGVGMKDSFGDYITPAAIGAAAGIAGMIAAKAMKKDKEEAEE